LERGGLPPATRASINQSDDHASILFASRVEDIDGLFDKETEIHIYRIVQESITNIFKHSAATEATVVIKRKPSTVLISIRDNGKGFNPSKLSAQSHTLGFGLTGIGERIRILKGTIVIDSKPQGGTSLTVEVPFKAA
jgi:signal transduction histidine kinase